MNNLKNTESNNSIEEKLNNQNTTLEDLLQEDNIINELRNQNEKLINFFTKEKIKKLIDYIIKEPKENDILKGHKFPFIASEILNSDEDKILDYFIMNKSEEEFNLKKKKKSDNDIYKNDNLDINKNKIEMFDYFLSFLETKKELNYVLTGYFSRFFQLILSRKPIKILNYLFQEKKEIINQLLFHCNRKSICDLFSKILNFDNLIPNMSSSVSINLENSDNYYQSLNFDYLISERTEILHQIFSFLKLKENPEKISNVILMLIELFDNKIILDEIMINKKIFNSVFKELKTDLNSNENINNSFIKNNYTEILTLINFMISNYKNNHLPKIEISQEDDMVEIGGKSNQKIIHTNLSENFFSSFNYLINNFKQNKDTIKKLISIPTSYNNNKIKPLGNFRIKLIDLFSAFFPYLKNISYKYDELLISTNFFSIAFNYLFTYEWNNLYQLSFLNLLKNYLKEANFHHNLSIYLFEKIKIIDIIKVHVISNDKISNKFKFNNSNKKIHRGYFPFLISLSYKINSLIGGIPLKLFSYSIEGSICFINNKINKKEEVNKLKERYNSNEFNISYNKSFIRKNSCDSLKKYYSEDWNKFFKENISEIVKLYENKLLIDNFINEEDNINLVSNNDINYNNDDYYNSEEIDLSDFVFVDEVKGSEKEEDIKNNIRSDLKVDELEMK